MSQLRSLVLLLLLAGPGPAPAAEPEVIEAMAGDWVLNLELSNDPDKQVEQAIIASGGRPDSGKKKGRGRYRGGPEEHALYDQMTYEETLSIRLDDPEIRFIYGDEFRRVFYTDGRGRSVSANGRSSDYSFGDWGEGRLFVESVPRDGGWTKEVYTLQQGGSRLRAELTLRPLGFGAPIRLVYIYDRKSGVPEQ